MPHAVGIDLGTTFSAAAWLRPDGRTEMIPTSGGDSLTPSAVLFHDAKILVGSAALAEATGEADRLAQWVKRDVGKPVYSQKILGQYLPPEAIQACILRQVQADIARKLGPDFRAIITVPAYFDEPRRRSTMEAAQMAGLDIIDIVNEPTAAALAFGEQIGYLSDSWRAGAAIRTLVFDLGGGTFDVTLMELEPRKFRTLATDGDARLGGVDWDMRLVDHAADAFKRQWGGDPRDFATGRYRLHVDCERAKRILSTAQKTTVGVEYIGQQLDVPFAREQFEELTADLLNRTRTTTRELLATAGFAWQDVSRVLLVGGATRMPMVQKMLQDLSGILPDRSVHPDEAVARGAAIFAAKSLSGGESALALVDCRVIDVNSHSLGVQGLEVKTGRRINRVILAKNTALPACVTKKFVTTKPGQRSLMVQILEGESRQPSECSVVGTTIVRDLPPHLPQGSPVQITFQYARNGRLSVAVNVPGANQETNLVLECAGARGPGQISKWRQVVTAETGLGAFVQTAAQEAAAASVPGVANGGG